MKRASATLSVLFLVACGDAPTEPPLDTQPEPVAAFAFNCAGRRSKLESYEEELAAMQKALGDQLPLFGCYCAGEMGPVDNPEQPSDALSGGSGWHVMFTIIAK